MEKCAKFADYNSYAEIAGRNSACASEETNRSWT